MATVNDLIKRSMRIIGALSVGETPKAEESQEALESLNGLIERWSNQRMMIYKEEREEFTLSAGTASYTLGPSQTFDTVRPQTYVRASVQQNTGAENQNELPVEIVDQRGWAGIANKLSQSAVPRYMWPQRDASSDTLYFYPVPSEAKTLVLYTWKILTAFSAITDTVTLPPGYEDAIVYNLAVRIAPEYGVAVRPDVQDQAMQSVAEIKRINKRVPIVGVDSALSRAGNRWDWRHGGFDG